MELKLTVGLVMAMAAAPALATIDITAAVSQALYLPPYPPPPGMCILSHVHRRMHHTTGAALVRQGRCLVLVATCHMPPAGSTPPFLFAMSFPASHPHVLSPGEDPTAWVTLRPPAHPHATRLNPP